MPARPSKPGLRTSGPDAAHLPAWPALKARVHEGPGVVYAHQAEARVPGTQAGLGSFSPPFRE